MNVKYYILNGVSASGKDTFVDFMYNLKDDVDVIHYSSITYVKSIAYDAGWDGNKDKKGRNLLSGLKHLLTEYDNLPFKSTVSHVESYVKNMERHPYNCAGDVLVFIDVREPEEIEEYKKYFNAKTVLIRNPSAEEKVFNESDLNVLNYDYDIVIWNDSTKEHLLELAKEFVENEICLHKN